MQPFAHYYHSPRRRGGSGERRRRRFEYAQFLENGLCARCDPRPNKKISIIIAVCAQEADSFYIRIHVRASILSYVPVVTASERHTSGFRTGNRALSAKTLAHTTSRARLAHATSTARATIGLGLDCVAVAVGPFRFCVVGLAAAARFLSDSSSRTAPPRLRANVASGPISDAVLKLDIRPSPCSTPYAF